jgi:NPCBM-associated, NEW3 domain of alpha-galactosidase
VPSSRPAGHEKDFFDGVDISLAGLAGRLGGEQSKLPKLRQELTEIAQRVSEAAQKVQGDNSSDAVSPLSAIVAGLDHVTAEISQSAVSASAKLDVLTRLEEKRQQAETALNLALNVNLEANVVPAESVSVPIPKEADALTTVSPGQEFLIAVKLHNGSANSLLIEGAKLEVPPGWNTTSEKTRPVAVKPGDDLRVVFRLRVPKDASYTRPYWHRDDPDRESLNHIDDERYATLPFPPPALRAQMQYSIKSAGDTRTTNGIAAVVTTPFLDDAGGQHARPLAVVPAFSVMLEPGTQVISTHNGSNSTVTVGVTSNLTRTTQGTLKLELPAGWRSEPAQFAAEFARRGEKQEFQFKVFPAGLQEGGATFRAVLDSEGEKYAEGYTLVTREDLGSFYCY